MDLQQALKRIEELERRNRYLERRLGMKKPKTTWIEYWDDTAQQHYYHNRITGESVWVKPNDF